MFVHKFECVKTCGKAQDNYWMNVDGKCSMKDNLEVTDLEKLLKCGEHLTRPRW